MIEIDVREKDPVIRAAGTLVALQHEGEGQRRFSFDIRVTTACGQVFCFERKGMDDLVGSFIDGKLTRQVFAAGMLIAEWDSMAFEVMYPPGHPRRLVAQNARKRVWHYQLAGFPVIWTDSPADTVAFLGWLEGKKEPVESFRDGSQTMTTDSPVGNS